MEVIGIGIPKIQEHMSGGTVGTQVVQSTHPIDCQRTSSRMPTAGECTRLAYTVCAVQVRIAPKTLATQNQALTK